MDNRMIDVAIGLALVFALTSLMVTALQEIVSQWSGKRGAVLFKALTAFAGDDKAFVKTLLEHQLLKSLSPPAAGGVTGLFAYPPFKWLIKPKDGERGNRYPSYIEADSLVSALIGQLVEDHAAGVRPQTPIELVSVVLQMAGAGPGGAAAAASTALKSSGVRPLLPNLKFAQGLATLANGVEQDWPAFEARVAAWYDAVNERATGWFKRDVRLSVFYVGLATAVIVNVNPLVIGSRLWEDQALRAAVVSAAQQSLRRQDADKPNPPPAPALAPAPKPTATELVAQASEQSGASLAVLVASTEAPAADVVARTEQAMESLVNAVIAEGEKKNLSTSAQGRLREVASHVIELDPQLKAALKTQDRSHRAALLGRVAEANSRLLDGIPASPVLDGLKAPHQALRDALAAAAEPLAMKVAEAGKEPALDSAGKTHPRHVSCNAFKDDADMLKVCRRMADLSELQRAGLPIGWTAAAWPTYLGEPCAQSDRPCTVREQLKYRDTWLNLPIALLGWFITALACTLGAPFWFDALSKLMKLRSSGAPPETAKGLDSSGTPPGSQLARSAAPLVAGVPVGGAAGPNDEFASKPRVAMSDALNDAERALDADEVKRVQRGIEMAEPDASGWFDGATRQAIAAWQRRVAAGPVTGELSLSQIASLLMAPQSDAADDQQHLDGCDVEITDPTDDADLPAARGGVA